MPRWPLHLRQQRIAARTRPRPLHQSGLFKSRVGDDPPESAQTSAGTQWIDQPERFSGEGLGNKTAIRVGKGASRGHEMPCGRPGAFPTRTGVYHLLIILYCYSSQVVLMQLQWFGVDPSVNQSRPKWHSGKMEKVALYSILLTNMILINVLLKHCSIYVRELEINFMLEKADRYQLILSAIKQASYFIK